MTPNFSTLRRDTRYEIAPGCGTIALAAPEDSRPLSGALTCLSVSGLGFEIVTGDVAFESGAVLGDCTLRVGRRTIRGEFTVRNRQPAASGRVEHGGLFYPASATDESQLHACIETLKSGDPHNAVDLTGDSAQIGPCSTTRGLYLRCGNCHRANWLACPANRVLCDCGDCLMLGEFADVAEWDQLGDLARQIGRQNEIDLPAGYSIVAGLMTLEQAMELGHATSPACRQATPGQVERRERPRYDPAFEDAVSAGLLAPIQAFERGRRDTFAQKLVERHGFDLEQALAVADNRTSLLGAIRSSRSVRVAVVPSAATTEKPRRMVTVWAAMVVAGMALLVLARIGLRTTEDVENETMPDVIPIVHGNRATTDRAATLRAATTVKRNESGQAVQVIGPDPHSVLLASCESLAGNSSLEAVEVTSAYPPSADARLGVVRDLAERELLVVPIHKDPTSRRWYAGNGVLPLSFAQPSAAIRQSLDGG